MRKFAILFISITLCACHINPQILNKNAPVDPFKLYMPSFNTAREKNDIYQEWVITNLLLGVHKFGIYNQDQKDSLYYLRSGNKRIEAAVFFHAQYGIPLPKSCKRMKINLKYEYRTINHSEFLMNIAFNNKTTLLKSINIPLEPTFSEEDIILPFSNKKIKVNIPFGANNCVVQLMTNMGMVALDRCDIEIDGKKIEAYTYNQAPPFSSSELKQIEKELSGTLQINDQVKILGIGESLHCSLELIEQATNIVKEKITNGDYRKIFLEVSPMLGYRINQYVQGESTNMESITNMSKNSYNNSYFIDLIKFIKVNNQKNKEKVIIAGFDIAMDKNSLDSLFRDVVSIYPKSEEIKSCAIMLTELAQQNSDNKLRALKGSNIEKISSLLCQAIEKSKERHDVYESYIYNYLLVWVRNSSSHYANNKLTQSRDSVMAENVSYLIQYLPETSNTIILGHLGHIAKNKQNRELKGCYTSSMGYYLFQKYGKKYMVLGLFAGSGTFWAGRYDGYNLNVKKGIYPVAYPIGKSIEQLCILMNKSSFYINNIKDFSILDRIVYERAQGAYWEPMQFEPVDLRKELNAIWFTKVSTAI